MIEDTVTQLLKNAAVIRNRQVQTFTWLQFFDRKNNESEIAKISEESKRLLKRFQNDQEVLELQAYVFKASKALHSRVNATQSKKMTATEKMLADV